MSPDEAAERIHRALQILKPTGIPFLDLCMWKGRFPSTKVRFCTFELKHEPVRSQVIVPALDEYDEVISWQGVRAQESPERALLPVWEEDADHTPGLHVYRPILNWLHEDVAECSRRGNSTFFPSTHDPRRAEKRIEVVTVDAYGIESYRDWALTTRGGVQFDLLAAANDKAVCSSVYAGVCE